ncbi:MAG: 30S ribosomal protein S6e [Candidatus Nanohalobium sp.]
MQITIGTSDGETFQEEIEDNSQLIGKKVGEEFDGGIIGLSGYTLKITGGSDRSGFPMRKSIEGSERKRVLLEDGAGINEDEDGVRRRKSIRGNTVSDEIEQLNTQVVKEGSKSVEELLGEEEEEE